MGIAVDGNQFIKLKLQSKEYHLIAKKKNVFVIDNDYHALMIRIKSNLLKPAGIHKAENSYQRDEHVFGFDSAD